MRIARRQLRRLRSLAREIKEAEAELAALVRAHAPELLELPGCGTLSAAKLIAEVAGVERFASDAKLAMLAGAAPLDASSGRQQRHRLNRRGNRQLNLEIPEADLAARLRDWTPPTPRYTRGVMAKYARLVSSASQGAVTG